MQNILYFWVSSTNLGLFYFSFEYFLGKKINRKIVTIRVFFIWHDHKILQCIPLFPLSLYNIGCHNDLNSFPWKIRCRESRLPQREKSEQKPDNLPFPGRHWSSVLTICTLLAHSYTEIFILKPNFIIPICSFLLWIYIALFVTSDNRGTCDNSFPAKWEVLSCTKSQCWGHMSDESRHVHSCRNDLSIGL